jgi:hypothetical protein
VDDAQAFFNAKTKKYYKSKQPPKPKKMTCHFCGEERHIKPKYKWKNVYRSMGFRGDYLPHLVAKRKRGKPPLHKQKKGSSYVMEASDNECPSESNDHLSDQSSENEEKQLLISFHMKATNSTQNKGDEYQGPNGYAFNYSSIILEGKWILDSGASHHITKIGAFLKDCSLSQIKINTRKQRCPIRGEYERKRTFQAKLEMQRNFGPLTLNNIIYNPEATANIVSISKLDEAGYKTTVDGGEMLITFNGNPVCRETKDSLGIYVLTSYYVQPPTDSILLFHSPTASETLRQLHERFGHVNVKTIIDMINNDVAEGLPTNRPSFDSTHFECPYCVAGKSTRLPFREADSTTKNRLPKNLEVGDEIHSDQKGPITPISHSENRFLIIFIDAGSKIAFIYFMTSLSETNDKYIQMRNLLET